MRHLVNQQQAMQARSVYVNSSTSAKHNRKNTKKALGQRREKM